jgi:hypothetical protein
VTKTRSGKWVAKIKRNGVDCNLGRYATPDKAAQAYAYAAQLVFGKFAVSKQK